MLTMVGARVHHVFRGGVTLLCIYMRMACACTTLTTHKLLICNKCVPQGLINCVSHVCTWVYLQYPKSAKIDQGFPQGLGELSVLPTRVVMFGIFGAPIFASQFLNKKGNQQALLRHMLPWRLPQVLLEVTTLPRQVTVDWPTITLQIFEESCTEDIVHVPQP